MCLFDLFGPLLYQLAIFVPIGAIWPIFVKYGNFCGNLAIFIKLRQVCESINFPLDFWTFKSKTLLSSENKQISIFDSKIKNQWANPNTRKIIEIFDLENFLSDLFSSLNPSLLHRCCSRVKPGSRPELPNFFRIRTFLWF